MLSHPCGWPQGRCGGLATLTSIALRGSHIRDTAVLSGDGAHSAAPAFAMSAAAMPKDTGRWAPQELAAMHCVQTMWWCRSLQQLAHVTLQLYFLVLLIHGAAAAADDENQLRKF